MKSLSPTKTDNGDLSAKLYLRRYFLDKYHGQEPIRVMDCCQGDAMIWRRLRKEYNVETYFGIDVKPCTGRIKLDSVRVLRQTGWPENVIDVDTYGSPIKHLRAIVQNIDKPLTVFLTYGMVLIGGGQNLDQSARDLFGLDKLKLAPPMTAIANLLYKHISLLMTRACNGVNIIEGQRVTGRHVHYVGLRMQPK